MNRIIFHIDVNSAFLSWEAAYRLHHLGGTLDLRTVPSAVGGDSSKRHGIILAKSIPAKQYHIHTGETVADARKKCPQLLLVPPNYGLYDRSSRAMFRQLAQYTDQIEKYSIDEAFLDMTGATAHPEQTAYEIKDRIREELGFTVNIGIAHNKLLAKMASDFQKPDRVHTLWPHEIPEKLWPLPVRDLFYVGHATEQKLKRLGIHTIGELAGTDPAILESFFKSHGLLIHRYANGIDPGDVIASPPPNKGYGNSLTTPFDVTEVNLAKRFLLSLAETISARLRSDQVKISVIDVAIRDYNLTYYHHQISLPQSTDLTTEIYDSACRCFDSLWNGLPIRHLGIHTGAVTSVCYRQIGFWDKIDYEKQKKAELAIDSLRKRYGSDCVKRGCFVEAPGRKGPFIDHMGGGISREKRSVDYEKEKIL